MNAVSASAAERQGTARYLQALGQHWPFILGSVALAVLSALAYLATAEERYEAHADVLVTPIAINDATFVGLPAIRESGEGRGVLTAARLVETPQVAERARKQLGTRTAREDLYAAIHVQPQEQSNIVTVTAESDTPAGAAALANAFAAGVIAERTAVFQRELRPIVRRLSSRLAQLPEGARDEGEGRALADRLGTLRGLVGTRDPTLQIASRAVPPSGAAWPRPALSLAVAVFAGLLLGVGVAIALELINPLVLRDEDILEEGVPLLGRVPRTPPRDLQEHARSRGALGADLRNAYQLARVNLSAAPASGHGTILVTSAARGEGKTSVAVELALVYAQSGAGVILVDADVRRGRLARVFGLDADRPGLREVLAGGAVDEALQAVPEYRSLRILAARPEDSDSVDLLQSRRVGRMVEELQHEADVVVFDTPPITEVADALRLSTVVDAVVLVVRYGRTRRDRLARARLLLAQLGVVPAGVIAVTRRRARRRIGPGIAQPPSDERIADLSADGAEGRAAAAARERARSSHGSS